METRIVDEAMMALATVAKDFYEQSQLAPVIDWYDNRWFFVRDAVAQFLARIGTGYITLEVLQEAARVADRVAPREE